MKTVVITLAILAALTTVGIVGYKKGWFDKIIPNKKPSDSEFQNMINTANKIPGSDVFKGQTLSEVKTRFSHANSDDISKLTFLMSMPESKWTAQQKSDFLFIFQKATGKSIAS